jgi:hypothetical protein
MASSRVIAACWLKFSLRRERSKLARLPSVGSGIGRSRQKTDHRRALRTFHGQKLEKHLTAEERGAADAFIEKHFCFLVPNEETETGLDWLLETMAATAALVGR